VIPLHEATIESLHAIEPIHAAAGSATEPLHVVADPATGGAAPTKTSC
jgi:hypothetical protein